MADTENPVGRLEAAWRAGNLAEAQSFADLILTNDPDHAGALMIKVNLCFAAGEIAGSRPYLEHLARLHPQETMIWNNLGRACLAANDLDAAARAFSEVLSSVPDESRALDGMGIVRHRQGYYAAARDLHRRAVDAEPDFAAAWCNLGVAETDLARHEEGADALDRALSLDPNDARSRFNRAILFLSAGDWKAGWPLYEARLEVQPLSPQNGEVWRGQALSGEDVLLVPEQGFGDFLQFVRFVRLVEQRGGKPVLAVPDTLRGLVAAQDWGIETTPAEDPSAARFWCPLMSLPSVFELEPTDIDGTSYIQAPSGSSRAAKDGIRVGLAWSGNPTHRRDRDRSLNLVDLVPVLEVPGVSFVNLQVGVRAADADILARTPDLFIETPRLKDFAATADVIAGLDLVISADTAVLHLAGAMGCQCWAMLPAVADWRWGREGMRTPWYDSMRLYRQEQPRDWRPVLEAVRADLRRLAED